METRGSTVSPMGQSDWSVICFLWKCCLGGLPILILLTDLQYAVNIGPPDKHTKVQKGRPVQWIELHFVLIRMVIYVSSL